MSIVKSHAIERAADEKIQWVTSIPFFLVHALVLLSFVTGVTPTAAILFLVLFWGRMFFITAGYHRAFSHVSYTCSPIAQACFAFFGAMADPWPRPAGWAATPLRVIMGWIFLSDGLNIAFSEGARK